MLSLDVKYSLANDPIPEALGYLKNGLCEFDYPLLKLRKFYV